MRDVVGLKAGLPGLLDECRAQTLIDQKLHDPFRSASGMRS
jgi:hypothetical protein